VSTASEAGPDADGIEHDDFCDTGAHTDKAFDCTSAEVNTHGVMTHIAATAAGPRVYLAPIAAPIALTAAACSDIATRFGHLAHILGGH
jgi:hypothetical protein